MNLFGSICLSDIPKELIKTAGNGKQYLDIEVYEKQHPGKYGDTHAIKASCRKSEQREGVNYYIGNLKPSRYNNQQQPLQ